jgi:hypothetical protein
MTEAQITTGLSEWERAALLDGIAAVREKMRADDPVGHALAMASLSMLADRLTRVFKHKGRIVIRPLNR